MVARRMAARLRASCLSRTRVFIMFLDLELIDAEFVLLFVAAVGVWDPDNLVVAGVTG